MADCVLEDYKGILRLLGPAPEGTQAASLITQMTAIADARIPSLSLKDYMLSITAGQLGVYSGEDPDGNGIKPAATPSKPTWVNLSQEAGALPDWTGGSANYLPSITDTLASPANNKGFFDFLGANVSYTNGTDNVLYNTPYTMVLVLCNQALDAQNTVLGQNQQNGANNRLRLRLQQDGEIRYHQGSDQNGDITSGQRPAGRGEIICVILRNTDGGTLPQLEATSSRSTFFSTGVDRGTHVYTGANPGPLNNLANPIRLGSSQADHYLGRMYEVGMWNRALTTAEIDKILRTFEAEYHGVRL